MKGLLKFITCGSVDDGKSTLIGHILYDAKLIYADQEKALELDSKVGSRSGDIDYSLLLDGLMAEREQGITIDVAYRYFTTDNRSFIVADTPGHEEYTRNMAVGASFADAAHIKPDDAAGIICKQPPDRRKQKPAKRVLAVQLMDPPCQISSGSKPHQKPKGRLQQIGKAAAGSKHRNTQEPHRQICAYAEQRAL